MFQPLNFEFKNRKQISKDYRNYLVLQWRALGPISSDWKAKVCVSSRLIDLYQVNWYAPQTDATYPNALAIPLTCGCKCAVIREYSAAEMASQPFLPIRQLKSGSEAADSFRLLASALSYSLP